MKYIIMKVESKQGPLYYPIMFPDHMVHSMVLEAMRSYFHAEAKLLGREEWNVPLPVSAGSANITSFGCYGKSETLGVKAEEGDATFINAFDYSGPMIPPQSEWGVQDGLIYIGGSNGELAVNPLTGAVDVDHSRYENDEYKDIVRIDVNEWRAHYPDNELDGGDILDFGYWFTDGVYEPPSEDWRKEISNA